MTDQHFHDGELRLQEQTGMRENIAKVTKIMMRDFMTDQHRQFFEGLEYLFLGTIDQNGLPHASIVTGPEGFAHSPDPKTLMIQMSKRNEKAAFEGLAVGQAIAVLGLDLSNRRRNRMHGRITALSAHFITITVVQSYGNCPKYINLREISERSLMPNTAPHKVQTILGPNDMDLIKNSDTFFIASYVQDGSGQSYEGADISHRGGKPGFVSVDSPTQLTIADYQGNYLFNTFGNLLLNPKAGLLFIDFETGDQLHIQGRAKLIEDPKLVASVEGAQRLLQIEIDSAMRQDSATSLRWRFVETSPYSPDIAVQ